MYRMHFDNSRLSFSPIYLLPFSNLESLFLTFMSFCFVTAEFNYVHLCDHGYVTTGAWWVQKWTHNQRQWLYLLQNPSIANSYHGEGGPYVPLPTGGELLTDIVIVMYRPKAYKFSCCKFMFKMTVLWLEDGVPYAFSLISRSFYFSPLFLAFHKP